MSLNPAAKKVWLEHGDALFSYPVKVKVLADVLGVTEWTVRQADAYAAKFGPPTDDDQPGALHLIIGDIHLGPENCNDGRMRLLGLEMEELGREAIANSQPFRVILIGDVADLHSLSSYDKGKLSAEGARLSQDLMSLAIGLTAFKGAVSTEVWEYADVYVTLGNHEHRLERYVQDHPELDGTLDISHYFGSTGITPIPFLDWLSLDGQDYSHYMQSRAGRAIGGVMHARSLLTKGHRSVTVGHSHIHQTAMENDVLGNVIQTLVAGCYFDHHEGYAKQSNAAWWSGINIKRGVKANKAYDLETRTLASLRRKHKEA